MSDDPSLAEREIPCPLYEGFTYTSLAELEEILNPWVEQRRRVNRAKMDRDLRAVTKDRSRQDKERVAARRALASLALSDQDPWCWWHAWTSRAVLCQPPAGQPPRAPAVLGKRREAHRSGRSGLRGAARRSSARSGDGPDGDSDDDPEGPEPPSDGRRFCLCGCGEDISHKKANAQFYDATHRQRGHRHPDPLNPGRAADPYLDLPQWELEALKGRRLALRDPIVGSRVDLTIDNWSDHLREIAWLMSTDADGHSLLNPRPSRYESDRLRTRVAEPPRCSSRGCSEPAYGPSAFCRGHSHLVPRSQDDILLEAAALLNEAVDMAETVTDPGLKAEFVTSIANMVEAITTNMVDPMLVENYTRHHDNIVVPIRWPRLPPDLPDSIVAAIFCLPVVEDLAVAA